MPKITIDETTFNKCIRDGKLQVAEWLLSEGCPCNESAYIQSFDQPTLDWLKNKNIPIPKNCLQQVISKTRTESVINWFITNGATVDLNSILGCIESGNNTLFHTFVSRTRITLGIECYKTAILAENTEILDHLNSVDCLYEESVAELAMKHKKKKSLKWLVNNGKF